MPILAESVLSIWTIYDHPKDFPGGYVARRWDVTPVGSKPTCEHIYSDDLEQLRDEMATRMLTCIPRQDLDDPVILESWL